MLTLSFIAAAFVAGVLMFLAPCTLPIVPGYLAFISGVPFAQAFQKNVRLKVFTNALAFVIGFSVIFTLLGVLAGTLGSFFGAYRYEIARFGGVLIIFFGLTLLGLFRIPFFQKEFHPRLPSFLRLGVPASSALIGAIFALGWSPCIGPILGSNLLIAGSGEGAMAGALLLAVFSLGLAVPFLLTALLISEAQEFIFRNATYVKVFTYAGGVFLVALGILMLAGEMGRLVSWGYSLFDFIDYGRLLRYL